MSKMRFKESFRKQDHVNSLSNQNGKNKPNHIKTLIIHQATWQFEDFE